MQLLEEIKSYMHFLIHTQNMQVCVCDLYGFPSAFVEQLALYHGHGSTHCQQVKRQCGRRCLLMQKFIRKKCKFGAPFTGVCHAGVREHIFPILEQDEYIGFLCVNADTDKDVCTLIAPLVHSFRLLHLYTKPLQGQDLKEDIYKETLRFIAENYTKKLTLNEIADALHYSPSYLCGIFRKKNKTSVMQYVRQLKLQHAQRLLRFSQKSVVEISNLLAFDTPNYFITVFKKEYGVSPNRFRQTAKKEVRL